MRSASTIPRSLRRTDPDDYDRFFWEFPQWVAMKRLGLVREMQLMLMKTRKELLTTQVTQKEPEKELVSIQLHSFHLRMILVLAEIRGDTVGPPC